MLEVIKKVEKKMNICMKICEHDLKKFIVYTVV